MKVKEVSIQNLANEWISTKSEKKLKEIIKRLEPGLNKLISEIEKDPIKRVDILTDAFSKMATKIDTYDIERGAFSTWVYRIARNEALLSKRHSNRIVSLEELKELNISTVTEHNDLRTVVDYDFIDEENSVIDQLYDIVMEIIKNFPENGKYKKWKRALYLREIKKKKVKEIGEIMKTKRETIQGWLCKSRVYIKKELEKKYPELVLDYKNLNIE